VDRRSSQRRELCLDVTLRSAGAQDINPDEITNLSVTGFLAEFPDGTEVPALLDVELPHAGSRTAEVVWTNGCLVGCNFSQPLTRSGSARLSSRADLGRWQRPRTRWLARKSIRQIQSGIPLARQRRTRNGGYVPVIGAVGTVPWLSILGLVALFA
jgi:hypothetical protein